MWPLVVEGVCASCGSLWLGSLRLPCCFDPIRALGLLSFPNAGSEMAVQRCQQGARPGHWGLAGLLSLPCVFPPMKDFKTGETELRWSEATWPRSARPSGGVPSALAWFGGGSLKRAQPSRPPVHCEATRPHGRPSPSTHLPGQRCSVLSPFATEF